MIPVYCIPGMGVDRRLFKNIKLQQGELRFIEWLEPQRDESLASYAQRLSAQIDRSGPFALLGVSFGGISGAFWGLLAGGLMMALQQLVKASKR